RILWYRLSSGNRHGQRSSIQCRTVAGRLIVERLAGERIDGDWHVLDDVQARRQFPVMSGGVQSQSLQDAQRCELSLQACAREEDATRRGAKRFRDRDGRLFRTGEAQPQVGATLFLDLL